MFSKMSIDGLFDRHILDKPDTNNIEEWCTKETIKGIIDVMTNTYMALYDMNNRLDITVTDKYRMARDVIVPGVRIVVYWGVFLKQVQAYASLSTSTFNKVTEAQRKRIQKLITDNGGGDIPVRDLLMEDVLSNDRYFEAVEIIHTFMKTRGHTLKKENTKDVSLKTLYNSPGYYTDKAQYLNELIDKASDDELLRFDLLSDSINSLPSAVDDLLFLMSLKNMTINWKANILDSFTWISYVLNEALLKLVYAVFQVPFTIKHFTNLLDLCIVMRNRESMISDDESDGPALEDLGKRIVKSLMRLISDIIDSKVVIDLEYVRYKMLRWKNSSRYRINMEGPEEDVTSRLNTFHDFEFGNPLSCSMLYAPTEIDPRGRISMLLYDIYFSEARSTGTTSDMIVTVTDVMEFDTVLSEVIEQCQTKKEIKSEPSEDMDLVDMALINFQALTTSDVKGISERTELDRRNNEEEEIETRVMYESSLNEKPHKGRSKRSPVPVQDSDLRAESESDQSQRTIMIGNERYNIDENMLLKLRSALKKQLRQYGSDDVQVVKQPRLEITNVTGPYVYMKDGAKSGNVKDSRKTDSSRDESGNINRRNTDNTDYVSENASRPTRREYRRADSSEAQRENKWQDDSYPRPDKSDRERHGRGSSQDTGSTNYRDDSLSHQPRKRWSTIDRYVTGDPESGMVRKTSNNSYSQDNDRFRRHGYSAEMYSRPVRQTDLTPKVNDVPFVKRTYVDVQRPSSNPDMVRRQYGSFSGFEGKSNDRPLGIFQHNAYDRSRSQYL